MADAACSEVRRDLLCRLKEARLQTDALFTILSPDSLYERPIAERHRIVFYIGHLEAFDRNLLSEAAMNGKSANPAFDRLFAFGIDPVGGGLPSDQPADWPGIEEIRAYNEQVRASIDTGLARASFSDELGEMLHVAIEHRLMHAETLAYMFHQLPPDRKAPPQRNRAARDGGGIGAGMVEVPGGTVTLGQRRGGGFGWDNEFDAHEKEVAAFKIDKYKVTNGEFLRFVTARGYEDRSLWRAEDWSWIRENGITQPVFWKRERDGWLYRAMFEDMPLALDWPVYVSHAEANAYARWAGKSLPTEAQWQRAADGTPRTGNFDSRAWNPVAVDAAQGESRWGAVGMVGNGWEWTASKFEPFEGFRPFRFYPGYSANFFDGRHFVLKGGSARTAACMVRPSFRNWFQPHYPYVYAGFRCVSIQG